MMKPTRLLFYFIIGAILLLAILFSGFFFIYEKTTEKQLMTYGQMVLDGSIFYMDSMMESTKDMMDNLSLDADVSMLLNYDSLSASNLLTGLRRLYKYEASSYFVDSIYVFNRRNNTVYVSSPHLPEAVYSISSFPDIDAASVMQNYSELKNMEPWFREYNTLFPTISTIQYISFIRYNALEKENASNVIMVNLRQDILSNLIAAENKTKGGIFFKDASEDLSMFVAGNANIATEDFWDALSDKTDKGETNFPISVHGNKYIVCTANVFNGQAEILLVADESIMASITRTKGYGNTIIIIGFTFATTLVLCIYILRRIWLSSVIQMETIRKAEEERQSLLEANKLNRILSFLHSDSPEDQDILKEHTGSIQLIILAIDHYASSITHRTEKIISLKNNILRKFSDLIGEQNVIFSVYEDDERCVACLENNTHLSQIENAKKQIESEFEISLTVITSGLLEPEDIQNVYIELCHGLSYRLLTGPGKMLTAKQIEERELIAYTIPENMLKNLTREILSINVPETLNALHEIISEISSCSYRSAQLYLLNLSVVLDDAFNKLQINNGIDDPAAESLIYRITRIESLEEIYTITESTLEKIEHDILLNKNNRQLELINEITSITDKRYREHDFSINTIADKLGMNASYLGRVFKKVSGETFSEFVLKKRMDEACRLLKETEESIDSIVNTVGFNDTPYFYKLFKRINGCTPVRYRQEQSQESSHADENQRP